MSNELQRQTHTAITPPIGAIAVKPPSAEDRLLAYGVLAVMIVENMGVAGYPPERFKVTIGGKPAEVYACRFEVQTGRRYIDTSVGEVVIPSALERAAGGMVTIAGTVIPGA